MNLINIGDTEERSKDEEESVDPSLQLLKGQKVVGEVKSDRLIFTRVDMEDDEFLGGESESGDDEIERYTADLSPEPQKKQN